MFKFSSKILSNRHLLTGMIGNICEHYDNALFAFLAPFISPLFFPHLSSLSALILTYGMLPLGLISRPLGALIFGYIGDFVGRKKALFISLLGMSMATTLMGCIPTYLKIGIYAPILLAFARTLQSFFAAGETTGGAIFVLEHFSIEKKSLLSSIYDASSIGGILIASLVVTLLSFRGKVETYWRYLFFLGSFTALVGIIMRTSSTETLKILTTKKEKLKTIIAKYPLQLVAIILVSGFSYANYSTALTLMNSFLPLINPISINQAVSINTPLLMLDLLLLPLFGFLSMRLSKEKMMMLAALTAIFTYIPLFTLLPNTSITMTIVVRIFLVMVGVCFSAPFHYWAQSLICQKHRFTIVALGYTLGSRLIGTPTTAISLWLFKKTNLVIAPAIYLVITALTVTVVMYKLSKRKKVVYLQDLLQER